MRGLGAGAAAGALLGLSGALAAALAAAKDEERTWRTGVAASAAGNAVALAGLIAYQVANQRRAAAKLDRLEQSLRAIKKAQSAAPKPAKKPEQPPAPKPIPVPPADSVPWAGRRALVPGGPGAEQFAFAYEARPIVRPSFRYKISELRRFHQLTRAQGVDFDIWQHNSKPDGYALARSCGAEVPAIYTGNVDIADLDFAALPARVALKPIRGCFNRGVFLLVRKGDDEFRNLLGNETLTGEQIRAAYRAWLEDGSISADLQIEELLEPRAELADRISIPDDLKVYCFDGRPVLVKQRRMFGETDHHKWRFKYWTADWRDMGVVQDPRESIDSSLEAPSGGEAVTAVAARISETLNIPFVRVDMYDTARGPVFGEITPSPGGEEKWRRDVDELLGREWELAETRILAEGRLKLTPFAVNGKATDDPS